MRRRTAYRTVYRPVFRVLERLGWHVTRNHFYSPIPDVGRLPQSLFAMPSSLVGVDLRLQQQSQLIDELAGSYRAEYDAFPMEREPLADHHFWRNNLWFTGIDPAIAWSLVRRTRPRLVIEVGSGMSTRLLAEALIRNRDDGVDDAELVAIDPHAAPELRSGFPGLGRLIAAPVQEVSIELFSRLRPGDVLFIDSSHVLRTGSDVQFLLMEVLPRLQPGVLVHFHDIFLPSDYPQEWLTDYWRFWNEQYVLAAFLAFNHAFEVVWGSHAMHLNAPDRLAAAIAGYDRAAVVAGGSFWIRRNDG